MQPEAAFPPNSTLPPCILCEQNFEMKNVDKKWHPAKKQDAIQRCKFLFIPANFRPNGVNLW